MGSNSDINIQHPEAWELLVSIDDRKVRYILYTPAVANSLMMGEVDIVNDSLQGLEDAIYDTPVLLNEYKRVRIIVHSQHFVLLPEPIADEDCVALLRHAFPGDDGDSAVNLLPQHGVKVAFLMPRGMKAFLGRTFSALSVFHHLVPLCEHFKELNQGGEATRMYLNLHESTMDLAIYREGKLVCANTYPFADVQEAVYYVLNAWRTHGLDQLTDELQLMGDNAALAAMTTDLRTFVKSVMPAVFPAAAMRLGRNAMKAPLELILLALCE